MEKSKKIINSMINNTDYLPSDGKRGYEYLMVMNIHEGDLNVF